MEFIFLIGGIILGIVTTLIHKSRERIHGIVHVDHDTEQTIFSITSDQLADRKKKIAVFYINHNAQISRKEQGL